MFFLCDPGLLLPPDAQDVREHEQFWRRLIEWAADKRVALGPETHDLIIRHFELQGWPDYQPPLCPGGLSNLARAALNRLLSTKREPVNPPSGPVSFKPEYVRHEDGELAIGIDLTSNWKTPPAALASAEPHWWPPSLKISVTPPPPEVMELVTEPNVQTSHDQVEVLRQRMASKRLTIVGGLKNAAACAAIAEYFDIDESSIRWLESTQGRQPQTDRLTGMRGHGDVLCCVIGCKGVAGLGHSGSEAAAEAARNRGVPHCKVETPSQILKALIKVLERKA